MKLAILGSGFIARFYADALVAQRRKDEITMVYSRTEENAKKFAKDYHVANHSTDIIEAVNHKDVDAVIIALANDMHLEAVVESAAAGKHVLCTKPLGRNAKEALQMLRAVDDAKVVGGLFGRSLLYSEIFKSIGKY